MLFQLNSKDNGRTMIMDKGVGVSQLQDTLAYARQHIDFLKYGFGTSCLYDPHQLMQKNKLLKKNKIISFPGGTLFEAAYAKNIVDSFFYDVIKYQFTGVEISHGTIDVLDADRYKYIRQAKQQKLVVFSEIGKKTETGFKNLIDSVKADLDAGSDYVILEGRESGTSGLYCEDGSITDDILDLFDNDQDLLPNIIWESPSKEQQTLLLRKFGPNVNLGNIAYNDILSLAALRKGLRSDTFLDFLA